MRCAIHKSCDILFKRFAERLTEIHNFHPLLPISEATKKVPPEDLNYILLHAVPSRWDKQAYIQGWYFEMKTFRETCAMFEGMEIAEQVRRTDTF